MKSGIHTEYCCLSCDATIGTEHQPFRGAPHRCLDEPKVTLRSCIVSCRGCGSPVGDRHKAACCVKYASRSLVDLDDCFGDGMGCIECGLPIGAVHSPNCVRYFKGPSPMVGPRDTRRVNFEAAAAAMGVAPGAIDTAIDRMVNDRERAEKAAEPELFEPAGETDAQLAWAAMAGDAGNAIRETQEQAEGEPHLVELSVRELADAAGPATMPFVDPNPTQRNAISSEDLADVQKMAEIRKLREAGARAGGARVSASGHITYPVLSGELTEIANRFALTRISGEQAARSDWVASGFEDLAIKVMSACPVSRERSLALSRLEEAMMWTHGSICREGSR